MVEMPFKSSDLVIGNICGPGNSRNRLVIALFLLVTTAAAVGGDAMASPPPPEAVHGPGDRSEGVAIGRRFTVEDVLRLEGIDRLSFGGAFATAADGRIAFVVARSLAASPSRQFESVGLASRSDIWILDQHGGAARNLTQGAANGSGWWAPQWSPDGTSLAVLSTEGGSVGLWTIDARTGRRRIISGLPPGGRNSEQPFVWLDSTTLLYLARLSGDRTFNDVQPTLDATSQGWRDALAGTTTTASVIRSGVAEARHPDRQNQLLLLRVGADAQTIASGVSVEWALAPDRRSVAFVRETGESQFIQRPNSVEGNTSAREQRAVQSVTIASLADRSVVTEYATGGSVAGSLSWSPASRSVAFRVERAEGAAADDKLHILDVSTGHTTRHDLNWLNHLSVLQPMPHWASEGIVLMQGHASNEQGTQQGTVREDWWAIGPVGRPENVSRLLIDPPQYLIRTDTRTGLVGIGRDGRTVWHVTENAQFAELARLNRSARSFIAGSWPNQAGLSNDGFPRSIRPLSHIVLKYQDGTYDELDLTTGRRVPVPISQHGMELAAFSPASGALAFIFESDGELSIWSRQDRSLPISLSFATNRHLAEVRSGTWSNYEYTTASGRMLNALVLRPPHYDANRRYPAVFLLYPDHFATGEAGLGFNMGLGLNPQLLAAAGYVVIQPSIPTTRGTAEKNDPLPFVEQGVVPAVERAVELGLIDRDRLYVVGHSYGAYSVFGLLTQTHIFKAAVAIDGFTDLTSAYGTFQGWRRYSSEPIAPYQEWSMPHLLESGQQQLGGPPWREADRYVRNSPIFHIDQVDTPLLIVHGDMDSVPIEQSEEYFTGLERMGRRAEFVRYLGEGHFPRSPANIRDFWRRIFSWLAQFGGEPIAP